MQVLELTPAEVKTLRELVETAQSIVAEDDTGVTFDLIDLLEVSAEILGMKNNDDESLTDS